MSARNFITGIGSLPFHNVDTAMEHAFRFSVPFLPQIPIRRPAEYMITQALAQLPGHERDDFGNVTINLEKWRRTKDEFNQMVPKIFAEGYPGIEILEPTEDTFSCWKPFLWELDERKAKRAKIQLAGPLTCQWAVNIPVEGKAHTEEITTQIFQVVLGQALTMTRRLVTEGVEPIFFFDEPGLYTFSAQNPRHMLALAELKLCVKTLQKAGAKVGLHCCSNTDWKAVLDLNLDFLSVDAGLSLGQLLEHDVELTQFVQKGRLSLGVIPTNLQPAAFGQLDPKLLHRRLQALLSQKASAKPKLLEKINTESWFTPACGLALLSPDHVETVLHSLLEFSEIHSRKFSQ